MKLDWKTVRSEHVQRACEFLLRSERGSRARATGLFILIENERIPAKHALRLAYCYANNLPVETDVNFASGEATLNVLRRLGFTVERKRPRPTA
jgi:hypothetical protein